MREWRDAHPTYRVYSDADVLPFLEQWGGGAAELFQSIRIPACRSDVARLVLLFCHGGLYVDAHCGPGDPHSLERLLAEIAARDLVLFDESSEWSQYRYTGLFNGVLGARAGLPVIERLIGRALRNLAAQRRAEQRARGAPTDYCIYKLTGPWILWHELFRRRGTDGQLKRAYRDRVTIWPVRHKRADEAIHMFRHNRYRRRGAHWSERQLTEPLFVLP
ncbi:MAG: hypothetical protein ABIW83_00975 [Allosphingosinicella sp.]